MSRNTRREWAMRNQAQPTRHPGSKSGRLQAPSDMKPMSKKNMLRWITTRQRSNWLKGQGRSKTQQVAS